MPILKGQPLSLDFRGKQLLVTLESNSISTELRKHNEGPWAHPAGAPSTSLALQIGRNASRRLMLQNRPNRWIVKADLQRSSSHHYLGVGVDAGVLTRGPAYPSAIIIVERMPDIHAYLPVLA
ncbi:hypothetical protein D9M68_874340 [compost metagenome]